MCGCSVSVQCSSASFAYVCCPSNITSRLSAVSTGLSDVSHVSENRSSFVRQPSVYRPSTVRMLFRHSLCPSPPTSIRHSAAVCLPPVATRLPPVRSHRHQSATRLPSVCHPSSVSRPSVFGQSATSPAGVATAFPGSRLVIALVPIHSAAAFQHHPADSSVGEDARFHWSFGARGRNSTRRLLCANWPFNGTLRVPIDDDGWNRLSAETELFLRRRQ